MNALRPKRPRRSLDIGLVLPVLALAACTTEHPSIPEHENKPVVINKAIASKVAADIAKNEGAAGDTAGAIAFYRQALETNPNQPKVEVSLGMALLQAGSPGEAAQTFRKVLSRFSQDTGALTGLGIALIQLGQPAAALDPLRKSVSITPDAHTFRTLGVAENLLGQNAQAEADYSRGLSIAPNDPGLANNLGLSMALSGNFNGAVAVLRKAASAFGATPQTRQNLALALGLAGRTADAAQVARADLDERSVQSNLAYYAVLRTMSPRERTNALLRPLVVQQPQPLQPAMAPAAPPPKPAAPPATPPQPLTKPSH
jgi:Flp pilus assembly protein TadD